jgi:hypothetical protein
VSDSATGRLSAKIDHFNYVMERLKEAMPDLIIQVGGLIAFEHPGPALSRSW